MPGALEDLKAGVGDAAVVGERGLDRDDAVAVPPDDERGDVDFTEALTRVVAEQRAHRVRHARAAQARLHLLPDQLGAKAVRIAKETAEGEVAGSRPGQADQVVPRRYRPGHLAETGDHLRRLV